MIAGVAPLITRPAGDYEEPQDAKLRERPVPSIAVVGFGRIGRMTVRAGLTGKRFTPSVIVDVASPQSMAPLFEVDSNYGRWPEAVRAESDALVIGDAEITW